MISNSLAVVLLQSHPILYNGAKKKFKVLGLGALPVLLLNLNSYVSKPVMMPLGQIASLVSKPYSARLSTSSKFARQFES